MACYFDLWTFVHNTNIFCSQNIPLVNWTVFEIRWQYRYRNFSIAANHVNNFVSIVPNDFFGGKNSTLEHFKLALAPWYSGHGLRLLHRRSQFDSHSRRFTWQVNEPSPGSTIPCEGNWVVSLRCWRDINYIVSIIAKMQFNHKTR